MSINRILLKRMLLAALAIYLVLALANWAVLRSVRGSKEVELATGFLENNDQVAHEFGKPFRLHFRTFEGWSAGRYIYSVSGANKSGYVAVGWQKIPPNSRLDFLSVSTVDRWSIEEKELWTASNVRLDGSSARVSDTVSPFGGGAEYHLARYVVFGIAVFVAIACIGMLVLVILFIRSSWIGKGK
jgi:hypothetical protein